MSSAKVYDYKPEQVERKLVKTLQHRKRESTVADLIRETGLPKYQVAETIKTVARDYAGHMKVTESGEILYYFPDGLVNRNRGFGARLRRGLRKFGRAIGKALTFLFKIWIVAMLIGYFVLFVALLVLAVVASIAVSASSRESGGGGRSRGFGGFGGLYLTVRVFEMFLWLWLYSGAGSVRKRRKPKSGRPLHQTVFSFVFGDGDPGADWEATEKRAVLRFVQSHKGVISREEFMALTGRDEYESQQLLNALLVEFDGEPGVTEGGTLVFSFPEVMRTRELYEKEDVFHRERRPLIPFNRNSKKANGWIAFFNGFNFVFGSYFLIYSTLVAQFNPERLLDRFYLIVANFIAQVANPLPILAIGLGAVPVVFAALFYAVPLLRRLGESRRNEEIKKSNLRKRIFNLAYRKPTELNPDSIEPRDEVERPSSWKQFVRETFNELAAVYRGEVEQTREARGEREASYAFALPDLAFHREDVERYRESIDTSKYELGKVTFDSGE
jgi:hypothetical protein